MKATQAEATAKKVTGKAGTKGDNKKTAAVAKAAGTKPRSKDKKGK